MQNSRKHILVRAFLDGELNEAQQYEFYELLKDTAQRQSLTDIFIELTGDPDMQLPFDESLRPVLKTVLQSDRTIAPLVYMNPDKDFTVDVYDGPTYTGDQPSIASKRSMRWIWAAASVLLLVIAGAYFFFTGNKKEEAKTPVVAVVDIPPGSEGAVLTLSDGRKMLLDSLADGRIASQQGADPVMKNRELAYESKKATDEQIAFNTVSTENGKQYQFKLPDGTGVWLNAGSSITFPTSFNSNGRNVKITGEVYFEVAKKKMENGKNMPFSVGAGTSNDPDRYMEVMVLGTHFNINAYSDEPQVRTTLLEGSVKVIKNNEVFLLQPGQQASLQSDNTIRIVDHINEEEILAWKNGYFYFDRADLQTVMRQLSRWYNVTVEYRGNIPDLKFVGEIPRTANLSEVFQILGKTKLRFTVEEKKIIVNP